MALTLFGITHTSVRDHFFPSLASFSASTKPTSTAVGQMIDRAAGELTGRLAAKGVTASSIVEASYPAAYAWCQDYLTLATAIRVSQAIVGAGAVPKAWRDELKAKQESLDEYGYLALGDAPAPDDEVNGPRSHGLDHDLYTGEEDDISTLEPKFRRDDPL